MGMLVLVTPPLPLFLLREYPMKATRRLRVTNETDGLYQVTQSPVRSQNNQKVDIQPSDEVITDVASIRVFSTAMCIRRRYPSSRISIFAVEHQ
jgi:hypothetical protein